MKHFPSLVLAALAFVSFSAEAAPKWNDDFATAQKQAQAEKKRILVDFTGSTWCPPCIQLEKEVFSTKRFQDYAEKNLVLMRVDFADPVSEPTAEQDLLLKRYIPGDLQLPTVVLASANGNRLGAVEYVPGQTAGAKPAEGGWLKKLFGGSSAKAEGGPADAFIEKIEKIAKK